MLVHPNSAEDITEEEAEQRIIEKFGKDLKVLTIPLDADMPEEMKEITRKWNSNHTTKFGGSNFNESVDYDHDDMLAVYQ